MGFVPDRRFASLHDAFGFIFEQCVLHPDERMWLPTSSGLVIPADAPRYLFRGENGQHPETTGAISRLESYSLKDGRQLSSADMRYLRQILPAIHGRFKADDYQLDEHHVTGLLQHYGVPTYIIDFTAHLGHALTFAVMGKSDVGRVVAMPSRSFELAEDIIDLRQHAWAERPRRQQAFGVIMPTHMPDLKSAAARAQLNVSWYEFPVTKSDRDELAENYDQLTTIDDDPSSGFWRFHLTEYVEGHGKMSSAVTDWLLERLPIAPRCFLVREFEGGDAVVRFRARNLLPSFDESSELQHSRRYWSSDYPDSSWDRMRDWQWPRQGSIAADPRTYHPDTYEIL